MPLTKSTGNMYPWVDYMHTHLRGRCPHGCAYCYARLPVRGHAPRQTGKLRLDESELHINYGAGKTIFIEHQNDLFAGAVRSQWVLSIMRHCLQYPENTYVFHTKNPARLRDFYEVLPPHFIVGATIESDCYIHPHMGMAPSPIHRSVNFTLVPTTRKFISLEPIMRFNHDSFLKRLIYCKPWWVSIGADSKGFHLPEPTAAEIQALIAALRAVGIPVRLKPNLKRILGRFCRVCGVTAVDCPLSTIWLADDLCSACQYVDNSTPPKGV